MKEKRKTKRQVKKKVPPYFPNNIAKKAVEHKGQHEQMELTANKNAEEYVWDLL